MTKEELEKEAEEYAYKNKIYIDFDNDITDYSNVKEAYLDGAESREKRIAELIALINAERKRQEKCDDVHLQRIAELEKENAELKEELTKKADTNHSLVEQMADLESENAELKETVIKMNNVITETFSKLIKSKDLLKQWLQTSKASSCDNINIVTETEQFLKVVEK